MRQSSKSSPKSNVLGDGGTLRVSTGIRVPTNLKRVQVLLHPTVMEKIEQLSDEDGLPLSKQCALLVEEALEARGAIDRKSLRRKYSSTKVAENKRSKTNTDGVLNSLSAEDLDLLKKIKALKELGM